VRNRHRIAAAGALIALATGCAVALWSVSGAGPWPRHFRMSGAGEPLRSAPSVSGLLRVDRGPAELLLVKTGEGMPERSLRIASKVASGPRPARTGASRAETREAGEGAKIAPEMQPLLVLSAERRANSVTGEILGMDPNGPRALTLWQIAPGGERASRLARGESARDGRFRFGAVLLPHARVRLVVTPQGLEPGELGASPAFEVAEHAIAPPRVRLQVAGEGAWRLQLQWAQAGATLLVADEAGREVARRALPQADEGGERSPGIEFEVGVAPGAQMLLVAQHLADGRRSGWRPVAPGAEEARESPAERRVESSAESEAGGER
jgi:hypothetical protein